MSNSIEKLRKQYQAAKQKENERAEKLREQENILASLRSQKEAAAEAGDLDSFQSLDDQIRKVQNAIYVLMKSRIPDIVTPEQTRAAWIEYASDHDSKMRKDFRQYEAKRKDLCDQFETLVKYQNEALKIRNELADMTGADPGEFDLGEWLPNEHKDFPMNHGALNVPEVNYFGLSDLWPIRYPNNGANKTIPAEMTLREIVQNRKAMDNPDFGH